MPKSAVFLHDHPNFTDLIRQVGQAQHVPSYLVEKDYWLMHSLWGLQQQGWTFQLKGGTSLSKGHQIIKRFSEDIDLRIEPPADRDVKTGKNQDKPAHVETRRLYFDWLAEQINQMGIAGFVTVERDTEYDDAKYRSAGIRLGYPVRSEYLPGIKDGILLEVGFDDTAPNKPCTISSWALDAALRSTVKVIDNRAPAVPCYSPAYTFVEKLQTVSTKFRQQQDTKVFPRNFLRHYYDLYCLLDNQEVQAFIGTPAYHARKKERFRAGDNLHIASNEAFLLTNPAVRALYDDKYRETASLYYAGQVPFQSMLDRFARYLDRL